MKQIILLWVACVFILWCSNNVKNEIDNTITEKEIWETIPQKDIIAQESTTCVNKQDVQIYIYMYHYIRNKDWDDPNAGFIRNAVITENFEKQMEKFSQLEKNNEIDVIFFSQLEDFQKNNCFPHKNLVLMTSDDGWDDNYINLYPIAKKYGIKFHLSIISNYTQENRYDNFMTQKEVLEVSDDELFEIIWHTYAHVDLRNLNDYYITRELSTSKTDLEKITNTHINTIVYPAGKYETQTINKSQEFWYNYGLTTISWINTISDLENTPFELKRIRVSRDSTVDSLTKFFAN